jgi:CheY-like chemotaxis protein
MPENRILLIDSDPVDLELTLMGLEEAGLSNVVDVAHDAKEALDYIYKRGEFSDRIGGYPVVILLDLKLPGMDGRELLKHLKTEVKLNCIPVVVFTGSQSELDIIKTYAYGANSYVIKPFFGQELFKVIKEVGLYWTATSEPPPVEKCILLD